jgi:hypothetical protein
MSLSRSPRLVKGGIVMLDPRSSAILGVIALQYNPDTLNRKLQVQGVGGESGDRSQALRLKGPPVETFTVEAEIDATDQLAAGDPQTIRLGIHPQLAALETLVYPASARLQSNDRLARSGALEIVPAEVPLTIFVWSKNRILPVRLTDVGINEEAFDPVLNPIRAKVSLGMRVLNVNDLGFDHRGGGLFMVYQQQKELLAGMNRPADLASLGIGAIP